MENKKTSLFNEHKELGAKFAPFAGFEMPIQYSSVKEEVIAVRNNVGVFDVSHMGEFFVEGPEAQDYIDFLLPNKIKSASMNKAVYSPLCREDGTVIDDLIVYKLEENKLLVCVNASNIDKDWQWFNKHTSGFKVELSNHSDDYSLLAVQGPSTVDTLAKMKNLEVDLNKLDYYAAKYGKYNNSEVIIARTGYTGEDGVEIFCKQEVIKDLWNELLSLKVVPCGLASRDVLRIEVGYPLYGHEIHDNVTPLDSGLKWTIKLDKENFIGKEALQSYSPKYRLVKLSLEKGIPRQGHEILNEGLEKIGEVVSGTMSVTLGKGVALCHIEKELFPKDKKFIINIRNKHYHATFHSGPFVSGGHK